MAFAFPDERWLSKSVLCLRDYNLNKFAHDVIAGITVGLVALPLAMAFAIASGLTPQAGIYCAIVTGFLVSALGGSKTQIGGPTGAFVVVVAGIVAVHGVDGLFMCTVMAGILLVVMGATGMGTGVKFLPRPVVIGFTNGIAVLIASTQSAGCVLAPHESSCGELSNVVTHGDRTCCRHSCHHVAVPRSFKTHSRTNRGDAGSNQHSFSPKASGRNYRHALWRNPQRPSSYGDTALARRIGARAAGTGIHGRNAGSHRVADVGGSL